MKPSMQSTGNSAKPDQSDTESKEQQGLQDADSVSMIAHRTSFTSDVLHIKDKVNTPKVPGRPKKPVDPEKAAKVIIIVYTAQVTGLECYLGEREAREEGSQSREREERAGSTKQIKIYHGQLLWEAEGSPAKTDRIIYVQQGGRC